VRSLLTVSVQEFLDRVAQRGSWVGGGSASAMTAALSAALLEKLLVAPQAARAIRRIRGECLGLTERDAEAFAKAIQAVRAGRMAAFRRSLEAATQLQRVIQRDARAVEVTGRRARRAVRRRLQSDLRCALVLARASAEAAGILVETNRAWLRQMASRGAVPAPGSIADPSDRTIRRTSRGAQRARSGRRMRGARVRRGRPTRRPRALVGSRVPAPAPRQRGGPGRR